MEERYYETKEIAEEEGCARITVIGWAVKNGVYFTGEGRRKTYKFTEADRDKFKARDKKRGRRWN